MFKISTREPGPVLGNLDLNRTLVGEPYSETWIRTWEPGPVLVYVLTRTRFCTHGPISVTHTVSAPLQVHTPPEPQFPPALHHNCVLKV